MRFSTIFVLAGALLATAAPLDDNMALAFGRVSARSVHTLEARFNACDRRCHNGKGKCPNKDICSSQCKHCLKIKKGFNPSDGCGCEDPNKCKGCEGCEEGCNHLDTDSAIAACYFSCSGMKVCKGC